MPQLGYKYAKPKKGESNDMAVPCGSSNDEEQIPRLEIRGKNLSLAKIEDMTNVGTEIEAKVKLRIKEVRRDEKTPLDAPHGEYSNSTEFEVLEFYPEAVQDAKPPESDAAKFIKGPAGAVTKQKMKPPTAKEALGDY